MGLLRVASIVTVLLLPFALAEAKGTKGSPGVPSVAPKAQDKTSEMTLASVYPRFASLKDSGFRELGCKLEVKIRRYEAKAKGGMDGGKAKAAMNSANDALQGAALALTMSETECAISTPAEPPLGDPTEARIRTIRSVTESLRAPCSKLSFHYFRNPLTDYSKEHPLVAQGGWYRLNFASGDYKLAAFLAPDLRGLREYSDGKESQTDVSFRQEGEKLAPAKMVVKVPGKQIVIDELAYEIKKGAPILSAFKTTLDDGEFLQEVSAKLTACKTTK